LADHVAQLFGEPLKVADLALDICQMVAGDGVDLLAIPALLASAISVPREAAASVRVTCSRRRVWAGMSVLGVRREKAALFQWVQIPPGDRSSRKQPEQSWR
jgi:hypothetical protein